MPKVSQIEDKFCVSLVWLRTGRTGLIWFRLLLRMFRWAPFVSLGLYSTDTTYHFHKVESPSLPLYSEYKEYKEKYNLNLFVTLEKMAYLRDENGVGHVSFVKYCEKENRGFTIRIFKKKKKDTCRSRIDFRQNIF